MNIFPYCTYPKVLVLWVCVSRECRLQRLCFLFFGIDIKTSSILALWTIKFRPMCIKMYTLKYILLNTDSQTCTKIFLVQNWNTHEINIQYTIQHSTVPNIMCTPRLGVESGIRFTHYLLCNIVSVYNVHRHFVNICHLPMNVEQRVHCISVMQKIPFNRQCTRGGYHKRFKSAIFCTT